MAARVFISHSGQYLVFEDTAASLESLKSWIEHNASIPLNRQILMTPRGKNIKSLSPDAEIFVYDKKNLSQSPDIPDQQNDRLATLDEPLTVPPSDAELEQWKEAARTNRTWALEAANRIRQGAERTENLFYEADTISRSVVAALDNVRNYLQSANQKFEETRQWALENIHEQEDALNGWEKNYARLSELPVRDEVASILRTSGDRSQDQQQTCTLSDLINIESLRDAEQVVSAASKDFRNRLDGIQSQRDQLKEDMTAVEKHIIEAQEPDTPSLVEEAETLAKRISRDYDDILKLQNDQKSLAGASRKVTTQFRDFIPSLQAIMADTQQAFLRIQETRNTAVQGYFAGLKEISSVQSRLSSLQNAVANLDFDEQDGLDALFRVFNMPVVYGCTLIEAARRSEWTNRMQSEVDSLHTDLSQITDDEQRRRKKWTSTYDEFLNKDLNVQDALIDIVTSKPRNAWPFVEREEINAYIDDLKALGLDDAVGTVVQRLKDLETPNRRQKLKAFKNGSVQDLAASSNHGNGDVRSLQDDKARLEEKVKAAESRVRKLEDLLHRQSQTSRPASGLFTPGGMSDFDRQAISPSPFAKQSEIPHRQSISLRRYSNTQDERAAAQKIGTLEAQIQKLQTEAHEERRSSIESRDKMQQAESVKQDLMANFESQKQEFEEERQLMDDENHKLKVRIEELEDELDRVLGSREATKMTHDQKMIDLKAELDDVRETLRDAQQQSQTRIENLDRDVSLQREKTANLERQLQECKDERNVSRDRNVELAKQLRLKEEANIDVISTLQNTHSNLSPAGSAPDDVGRLARALEILSEGAGIHARRLDDNLQLATAENKSLEEKVTHHERNIKTLMHKLSTAESKLQNFNENLEHERTKLKAVRGELAASHADLESLREKLAAGETGSDTLRERLSEEEKKVNELQELKFEQVSTIQSLKHEIETTSNETKAAKDRAEILRKKLTARGEKARQLSERLYQHNDRIVRMLEQFGFSISRQDNSLVIQRASKVSSSTLLSGNESSTPMKRTISGSVQQPHYSDPSDLDTLYWTSDTESTDEDAKYQSFISALQRLDLDATLDTASKRYKDVENLAKKYQKDSRTYRERAHRLQSETHDKIAYRSFKEGDLALFLPTRNQATRPWAAFNVGAPHYFLREQDHHKLQSRDWLLARISRVEERVVDLSRSLSSTRGGGASMNAEVGDSASARSFDDENPFELSDGLRWYLIDASEEKPGAPGTPSVGKSTVIASTVEAEASMGRRDSKIHHRLSGNAAITKTLNKSLESRRSSSASKRSVKKDSSSLKDAPAPLAPIVSGLESAGEQHSTLAQEPMVRSAEGDKRTQRGDAKVFDIAQQSPDRNYHDRNDDDDRTPQPLLLSLPNSAAKRDVRSSNQAIAAASSSSSPPPPSRSRTQSPLKQRNEGSPARRTTNNNKTSSTQAATSTTSPNKTLKPWERLFNVEYSA